MEQAENAVPDKINLREHRTDGNVPPDLSLESLKGPEGTDQSQGLLRVTPTWDSTAPGMGILKKKTHINLTVPGVRGKPQKS